MGYTGRLGAVGRVISDQFRYALECGFDDAEIDEEQARRQPEAHWIGTGRVSYRDRLHGRAAPAQPARHAAGDVYRSRDGVFEQRVTHVEHFTDGLFSFRITRPASFRFRSGEFAMIGLPNASKPIFRAYSIASPAWDDELEFYSIKVPDGPLTEHLQHIAIGETVLLRKKATGTLVADALAPAKRLYLLSTGTGIAPFASLIREPEIYAKFGQVILTHTCRYAAELAYGHEAFERATHDALVGEYAKCQLTFCPTTKRDASFGTGRITHHLAAGEVFRALDLPALDAVDDLRIATDDR